MGRITVDMLRRRAEHNEGMITTLEEVSLHQQSIERIELLGHVCRHLRILYLQNNLIGKIENLHRLKELEYLNMAVNNITRIENLQRCESLQKLDFTMCFVDKAGLLTLASLSGLSHLRDLYLVGNPCTEWEGYRAYVVATLPQLARLDGKDIKPSERIAAQQALPELTRRLREELLASGIDPDAAARVDNQGPEDDDVQDPGHVDPETGEFVRPWCPATRIIEHRENEERERKAEEDRKQNMNKLFAEGPKQPPRRDDFDDIAEGETVRMRNEGGYAFSLEDSEDGASIVLEVDVGRFVDTSLIKADVRPTLVRLLIKGRLLQLILPEEVRADDSKAERSQATGRLVVTMPKAGNGGENPMLAPAGHLRAVKEAKRRGKDVKRVLEERGVVNYRNIVGGSREAEVAPVPKARLTVGEGEGEGDDDLPPL